MRTHFLLAGMLAFMPIPSQGAVVVFDRQGNDLFVEFRDEIRLYLSMSGRELIISLIFDDVYSVPLANQIPTSLTANTISATHTGGLRSSLFTSVSGVIHDPRVGQSLNDLSLGFNLRGVGSYSAGDQIVFSPGTTRIVNFFSSGGSLPDMAPTTVRVIAGEIGNNDRVLIAGPSPIPEPSVPLIFGVGLAFGLARRKRERGPVDSRHGEVAAAMIQANPNSENPNGLGAGAFQGNPPLIRFPDLADV
jgi:hypothetical protein